MLRTRAIMVLAGFLLLASAAEGRARAQSETVQALRRAVQLQQDGDLNGAIQQYRALLVQYPDLAEARVKLGNAYASIDRFQDAAVQYEQALESGGLADPNGARYALGWAHFRMADFERAKQALVQVVAAGSKGREALQLLASCHFNLGEWQKVIALLSPLEAELSGSPALNYLLASHWKKAVRLQGERHSSNPHCKTPAGPRHASGRKCGRTGSIGWPGEAPS